MQTQDIAMFTENLDQMRHEIAKRIHGYAREIDLSLIALAASGHVLYTGFPGLAKTLLTKTIAEISGCEFKRIQLTADMMPADITGVEIWRPDKLDFEPRKGPIVTQIVHADEINRAPPKTQSAFMEAMEEHRVTIWDHTMNLGPPFHVFATRNHIEADGIYPLPVAQLDRFLFELVFPYPEEDDEIKIAQQGISEPAEVNKVCDPERLLNLARFTSEEIYASDLVLTYAVKLIRETRTHEGIRLGASPRATQKLISASKAHALAVRREAFVTPDDVDAILEPLLNPRILLRNPFYDESEEQDEKKKIIEEVKRMAKEKHVR